MIGTTEVTQCIVNILIKEQQSEEEINKIREFSDVLTSLNIEKSENEKKINDLENELKTFECDQQSCDLELLKIELASWEITYKEAKEIHDLDVKKMEEAQQSILNNQKFFCDAVGEFITNHGIRATLNRNFNSSVRGQMAAAMSDTDAVEICTENIDDKSKSKKNLKFKKLEDEIAKDKILLEQLEIKYINVQKSNECLQKEYENGTEFIRLRNALKYSRNEAAMFRHENEQRKNVVNSFENRLSANENKSHQFGSAVKGKFYVVPKQRMITDFIKAPETSPSMSNLQNRFEYTGGQSSSMNFEEDHEMAPSSSYKLVEIMEPSNPQDNEAMNQNNITFDGSETKMERNTKKNFPIKNDIYKEIFLLKEKTKASGKPKKKQFTYEISRKK